MGEQLTEGDKVPDFELLDNNLKKVSLSSFKNKIKVIASVPSLDTPICDLEIKRFNDEAAGLSKDMAIIFVSMDLPFAQKHFCEINKIKNVKTLSDHYNTVFGLAYGVLIKELRLLSRAVFIADSSDILRHVEYVKEIGSHPDYAAALTALKALLR
jgi:thiol peroxidase